MNQLSEQAGCRWPHPIMPNLGLYLLRPDPKPGKGKVDPGVAPQDKTLTATTDAIICRQCLNVVTSPAESRVIDGAHTHTFANPEGIVYEIACYRDAWGCGYVGPASSEFTWFAGYRWRIAVCANCLTHLGWRFASPDGHFFHGLISSRIIANGLASSQST
jgi:hypothetical protein